jgi:hypothetical protein
VKPLKENDHCVTPPWLYKALDAEFAFDLDPCPLHGHKKQDGLKLSWDGRRVFCNPPYSDIRPWVEKALQSEALTVFLVPRRFDARWMFMLMDSGCEMRIFRRDFRFVRDGGADAHPRGGTMIAVVRRLRFDLTPDP